MGPGTWTVTRPGDLARATAECLVCQQQRPALSPLLPPFPMVVSQLPGGRFITLKHFHYGRSNVLFIGIDIYFGHEFVFPEALFCYGTFTKFQSNWPTFSSSVLTPHPLFSWWLCTCSPVSLEHPFPPTFIASFCSFFRSQLIYHCLKEAFLDHTIKIIYKIHLFRFIFNILFFSQTHITGRKNRC